MGNSRAALDELTTPSKPAHRKTPVGLELDPITRLLRDEKGMPMSLRDLAALVLHAGFVAQNRQHNDPYFNASAAWQEVDYYFEARANYYAAKGK